MVCSAIAPAPLANSCVFAKVLGLPSQTLVVPRERIHMPTVSVPFQDLAERIQQQEAELAKLRQELESRRSQLSELTRRKEELIAELAKVEEDIAAIGQASISGPRVSAARAPSSRSSKRKPTQTDASKSATKPSDGVSLPAYLVELVRQAKGPITAKELAATVVRNKFPTTSKNVGAMVKSRVHDLIKKGLLRRASDSSGLVLTQAPRLSKSMETNAQAGTPKNGKKKANAATPTPTTKWRSLHEVLMHVLAKSSRPLSAQELAEQAIQSGYESKSKDLKNVIWVSIGKLTSVERVPGKGYQLKKGKVSGAKQKT